MIGYDHVIIFSFTKKRRNYLFYNSKVIHFILKRKIIIKLKQLYFSTLLNFQFSDSEGKTQSSVETSIYVNFLVILCLKVKCLKIRSQYLIICLDQTLNVISIIILFVNVPFFIFCTYKLIRILRDRFQTFPLQNSMEFAPETKLIIMRIYKSKTWSLSFESEELISVM